MQAKEFYNQKVHVEKEDRPHQAVFRVKHFNNLVKSFSLAKFVPASSSILELGSGCSDVNKFSFVKPTRVIFTDISQTQIQQCQKRWKELSAKRQYPAQFGLLDFTKKPPTTLTKPIAHVVTCQFAMHYAFHPQPNYQDLHHFMSLVSACLPVNGRFLGITADGNQILSRLARDKTMYVSPHYSLEWVGDSRNSCSYHMKMGSSVSAIEYLTDRAVAETVAAQYGLELVVWAPLLDWVDFYQQDPKWMELARIFQVSDSSSYLNDADKDLISIYSCFLFHKKN